MPWERFVRTRIFAPLGMTETEPTVAAIAGRPNVATPHANIRDTVRIVPVRSTDAIAPAGSVWSSVADMSRWMRFVLDSGRVGNRRLIAPETFREMVAPEIRVPLSQYAATLRSRPHVFTYALGWFVQDYQGQTVWMHTGSIDGMSAIIGLLPDRRVGVYVLANLDHAELRHALMYKVFDLYSGNRSRDWSTDLHILYDSVAREARAAEREQERRRVTGTNPSLPLERYAGTYTDSTYGNVTVTLANGRLHFRYENTAVDDVEHWEYDTFRALPKAPMEPPFLLTFTLDGAGNVSSVRAVDVTFVRAPAKSKTG
jgi:CubicO group peptidase (beta-lactamase class C family)